MIFFETYMFALCREIRGSSRHFQTCIDNNITTIVAVPEIVNSNETGTTKEYMVDKFIYNQKEDTYTCPAGEWLHTNGNFYSKTDVF